MDEQQILDFVRRVSQEAALRKELANNPTAVTVHEGFSPHVAHVVLRLIPHLTVEKAGEPTSPTLCWWVC